VSAPGPGPDPGPERPGGPLGFDVGPEPGPAPPRPPAGPPSGASGRPRPARPSAGIPSGAPGRQGRLVGIAAVVLLAVAGVSAFAVGGGRGATGLAPGDGAPPFAAPLAGSRLGGDVNVATPRTVGRQTGVVPACDVRRPDVLNVCVLWERGPVALAFFSERSEECVGELDRLDDAARRHPRVQIAAVAIRGDRATLRELVASRGWAFPVGVDRDGILADLYGVVVCPQVTLLARGGRVAATSAGTSDPADLDRRLAALTP
jgi:hypothetical protein